MLTRLNAIRLVCTAQEKGTLDNAKFNADCERSYVCVFCLQRSSQPTALQGVVTTQTNLLFALTSCIPKLFTYRLLQLNYSISYPYL